MLKTILRKLLIFVIWWLKIPVGLLTILLTGSTKKLIIWSWKLRGWTIDKDEEGYYARKESKDTEETVSQVCDCEGCKDKRTEDE